MPAVSYDSLSFFHDGARAGVRRFPIVGAAIDPSLSAAETWPAELARLRHGGFNTVVARIPWSLHEPTPDRFEFSGVLDLRRFIQDAGAEGFKVILRIGPCVGGTFASGGLPSWIGALVDDRLREASPAFMQRLAAYWRRLMPEFRDLQATRNGSGAERPVIAVGIEDHWHSLDAEVGAAYFRELVRFAREFGVDVPLISANNCWYMHEGVVDTWCRESDDPAARMEELRQVQPGVPALALTRGPEDARRLAERVLARSDFAIPASEARHRGATSAFGLAEVGAVDLFDLRGVLVFASTFGDVLAGMSPEEIARSIELRVRPASRPRTAARVEFHASGLVLDRARLQRCTGALVARAGDLLVVSGKARGKIELKVDGSAVSLTVPADGGRLKCVRARGLRVVAVPHGLADGVGVVDGGLEFVDRDGRLLAAVRSDGAITQAKLPAAGSAANGAKRAGLRLGAVSAIAAHDLLDGSHARFASMDRPRSLGAYGVCAQNAYYRARFKHAGKSRRLYAAAAQRFVMPAATVDGVRRGGDAACGIEIASSGMHTVVFEARDLGLPAEGRSLGAPTGVFGPLLALAPLKRVKRDAVPQPGRDATAVGRFIWGLDVEADAGQKTFRWTFPAQKQDVVAWIPQRVAARMSSSLHAFRLNGELLPLVGPANGNTTFVVLPAAKLSPSRPKALKKGEKPPKARNAVLEPGDNELVYDGVPEDDVKELALFAVAAEVAAEWAFARVDPPASWASAKPVAASALAKANAVPTWFRTSFDLDAPRAITVRATFAAGAAATVHVNGASALVQDGASGARLGKGAGAKLVRTAFIAARETRAGANEILVFSPDGRMPAITVAWAFTSRRRRAASR